MPRQIDLTPQNLKVTNNPTNQLTGNASSIQAALFEDLPAITIKLIEQWVNQILAYIDQVTGLDLVALAQEIESVLGITDNLLTGLFGQIPLIGPLLSGLTGSSTTGGGGLGGLTSVFTDVFGLLGNPTGLGTGSPGVPTGSIPILGPLINAISTGFGGGSGLSLGGLTSLLSAIPGAGQVLDTIVNTFLGLGGGGFGSTDLIRALESIPASLLTGTLPPGLGSNLGVGMISNVLPQLLNNPIFDTANSIIGQNAWTWDGTQGPGSLMTSVFTDAGGVLRELFSNVIHVAPGQVLNISGNTKWGNSFNGGANSIALTVAQFANGVLSSYSTIGSIASPGTSGGWSALSGSYTVPSGIDSIFVRPTVGPSATTGRVWFGGMSATPTATTMPQSLVTDLVSMFTGLGSSSILGQLIGLFGGATSGLSGLGGLGAIFNDITGILGNPTSLGTGSPNFSIPTFNVSGIQGIFDIGSTAQNTWNQLTTAFGGSPANNNQVQQISVGGSPTGGTFKLFNPSNSADVTGSLAYNATASAIQTALSGLTFIGSGNVAVSGGPLMTAPVNVTFQGALANTPIALLGHTDSLTGGPGPQPPAVALSEITRGGPAVALSTLTSLAQQQTLNASNAITMAFNLANILGIRNNRPVFGAVHQMSEGTHNVGQGGRVTVTATSTSAPMAFQIIQQDMSKTFLQTVAAKTGTVTNFYYNVYKIDGSNNLQSVWNSPDLSGQLGASNAWITADLSGAPVSTHAGEAYGFEPVVVGSGSVTMLGQVTTDVPTHPTAIPAHPAASRNPTGNLTPTTITAASVSYGGNQPFFGFGSGTPPPAVIQPQTTSYSTHGSYTYTIPTFAKVVGAKLDLIPLGGGGGGQGEQGYNLGQGGYAGSWTGQTLVCGTDYPTSATSLTVVVGQGGPQQITYFSNGINGTASTVTWTDPGSTVHTLTAAGGVGGHGAGFGYNGQGSGNFTWNSIVYPGGTNVGSGSTGSSPGGGGGGAPPYLFGGGGADGAVWIVARPS